jgi:hypothetical protein
MMSSFFSKSSKAIAITAIIWMLNIYPYMQIAISTTYQKTSGNNKKILGLLHNAAISIGMRIVLANEPFEGVQWRNLSEYFCDNVNLEDMMMMLAIDGFIYILIIIFINFFTIKLKKLKVKKKTEFEVLESLDFYKTIEVRDLCKNYSRESSALENLSMDFYEDQITVILGEKKYKNVL